MTKYALPKTLTLNYRTWRCGGDSNENGATDKEWRAASHGKGDTFLCNEEGYMCCLGQFERQAGVPKDQLMGNDTPAMTGNGDSVVTGLSRELFESEKSMFRFDGVTDTKLANSAIKINDNSKFSIAEKVVKLCKLFARAGYKIQPKNFPKKIMQEIEDVKE